MDAHVKVHKAKEVVYLGTKTIKLADIIKRYNTDTRMLKVVHKIDW